MKIGKLCIVIIFTNFLSLVNAEFGGMAVIEEGGINNEFEQVVELTGTSDVPNTSLEDFQLAKELYLNSQDEQSGIEYLDQFTLLSSDDRKSVQDDFFKTAKSIAENNEKNVDIWTFYCWATLLERNRIAKEVCLHSYKLDVLDRNANLNLAHLYHSQSKFKQAKQYLKQASYLSPMSIITETFNEDANRLTNIYSQSDIDNYVTFIEKNHKKMIEPLRNKIIHPYAKLEETGLSTEQEIAKLLTEIKFVTQHLGADSVMNALSYQRLANISADTNDSKKYSEKALKIFNTHGLNEQNSNNVTLNIEF